MKRHDFGINLDAGIPLETPEELSRFYVDAPGDVMMRLTSWIETGEESLLFGGQIGAGKTTVIRKAFLTAARSPDLTLHFDFDGTNHSSGDFWRILLAGFVELALRSGLNLAFCSLPAELAGLQPDDWESLVAKLSPAHFSAVAFRELAELSEAIESQERYIASVLAQLVELLETSRSQAPIIIASGVDKYAPSSAGFFSLQGPLEFLSASKTLYEVNAIHLFGQAQSWQQNDKVLLHTLNEEKTKDILIRRMGVYAEAADSTLKQLVRLSGGNPRQAIRLLSHFEASAAKPGKSKDDRVSSSIEATIRDFFSFAPPPTHELLRRVDKDEFLSSNLLALPGDKETARQALYGNWILITDMAHNGHWPALVNPIIHGFYDLPPPAPADPESALLKRLADQEEMSPLGASPSLVGQNGRDGAARLQSLIAPLEISQGLNLAEVFDALAAALLTRDRSDRVIIAFSRHEILETSMAFLFAKANTFEHQSYTHITVQGGSERDAISEFIAALSVPADVLSVRLDGAWTSSQLQALDKLRDRLIEKQLICWLPIERLESSLRHWPHLRQLFEIYVLEDELLQSLSVEEIENDLDYFEDLVEVQEGASDVVKNLKQVLEFLRDRGD